jgi:hypothetical protein
MTMQPRDVAALLQAIDDVEDARFRGEPEFFADFIERRREAMLAVEVADDGESVSLALGQPAGTRCQLARNLMGKRRIGADQLGGGIGESHAASLSAIAFLQDQQ